MRQQRPTSGGYNRKQGSLKPYNRKQGTIASTSHWTLQSQASCFNKFEFHVQVQSPGLLSAADFEKD
jgi:hypothetical protein